MLSQAARPTFTMCWSLRHIWESSSKGVHAIVSLKSCSDSSFRTYLHPLRPFVRLWEVPNTHSKSGLLVTNASKRKMSQINNRQLQTFLNIKISTSLVEFVFVLNLDLYFPCLHHHHHHHCTICNSNSYIFFQTFSSISTSLVHFVFVFLSFRVYYVYYLYVYCEVSGRRLNLLFKCVDCTATNGERLTVKVYRWSLV